MNWPRLVAQLCIDLGWTRDDVLDQVDIPFLQALNAEWRQAPPIRRIAAAFAGYKPPREAAPTDPSARPGAVSIASLQAMFPNGRL